MNRFWWWLFEAEDEAPVVPYNPTSRPLGANSTRVSGLSSLTVLGGSTTTVLLLDSETEGA